jgi:hypothetical protein
MLLTPNPRQLLLTGVRVLVAPLLAVGADRGYSPFDIVRAAPMPVGGEQRDRDESHEGVVKNQSHGSDGQKEAKAAEKAVDDDF